MDLTLELLKQETRRDETLRFVFLPPSQVAATSRTYKAPISARIWIVLEASLGWTSSASQEKASLQIVRAEGTILVELPASGDSLATFGVWATDGASSNTTNPLASVSPSFSARIPVLLLGSDSEITLSTPGTVTGFGPYSLLIATIGP